MNLTEAQHVVLVEPLLDPAQEVRRGVTCLTGGPCCCHVTVRAYSPSDMASSTTNVDQQAQAVGRVDRIGQTKESFVHRFIVQASVRWSVAGADADSMLP